MIPWLLLNSLERPWIRHEDSSGSLEGASTHTTSTPFTLDGICPEVSLPLGHALKPASLLSKEWEKKERMREFISFFTYKLGKWGRYHFSYFQAKSLGYKVIGNITSIYYTSHKGPLYWKYWFHFNFILLQSLLTYFLLNEQVFLKGKFCLG